MFIKQTVISGNQYNGDHKCLIMAGHWNINSAINRARKSGIVGEISIKHAVTDTSGKGRGGHDGRWSVDASDIVTQCADWSEFGKEHAV